MKKNLLLLHGALGSGQSWKKIIPLLEDDFTVFSPDLPGHGSSRAPVHEGTADEMVSFIEEYIQQNIAGDYFIAGYSMGGYLALKLALEKPAQLKGIITIATKFRWSGAIAEKEAAGLTQESLAPILHHLQKEHQENFPAVLDLTQRILRSIGKKPLDGYDARQISIPVYVTVGELDKMVTRDETMDFAGHLPDGTVSFLSGQPHLLQKMDEQLIADVIKKTFNR